MCNNNNKKNNNNRNNPHWPWKGEPQKGIQTILCWFLCSRCKNVSKCVLSCSYPLARRITCPYPFRDLSCNRCWESLRKVIWTKGHQKLMCCLLCLFVLCYVLVVATMNVIGARHRPGGPWAVTTSNPVWPPWRRPLYKPGCQERLPGRLHVQ